MGSPPSSSLTALESIESNTVVEVRGTEVWSSHLGEHETSPQIFGFLLE